jgi:hypothetical protein
VIDLPDDDPIEDVLARARHRSKRCTAWLDQLRAGDPPFAEASALYPEDMSEWQSAVYLLTGNDLVWGALGRDVIGQRSIGPAIDDLEEPRRAWSSSEDAVMAWAAHFWDVDRKPAKFPYVFEQFLFYRWITACHLRQRIPPALTVTKTLR